MFKGILSKVNPTGVGVMALLINICNVESSACISTCLFQEGRKKIIHFSLFDMDFNISSTTHFNGMSGTLQSCAEIEMTDC